MSLFKRKVTIDFEVKPNKYDMNYKTAQNQSIYVILTLGNLEEHV